MRRRLFASALAITALSIVAVLAGPRGASAGTSFEASNAGIANVRVSSPVSDVGTAGVFGTETCTTGTYETNRSESNLAVDPTDPTHLLGSSKFFYSATDPYSFSATNGQFVDWSGEYQFNLGFYDIRNGAAAGNALIPGYTCDHDFTINGKTVQYQVTTDPVIDFDRQGNAYAFVLAFRWIDGANGVYVSKRDAGTQQWGAPVEVQANPTSGLGKGHEFDKQWLAVDRSGGARDGNVYVIYVDFSTQNGRIRFARSTDHGATFANPITLSDAGGGGAHGQLPQIGVDGRGIVYAVWNGAFQGNFKGQGSLLVAISSDGGDTWSKPFDFLDLHDETVGTPGTFNSRIIQNTTFRQGIPYYFTADARGSHVYAVEERWSEADTSLPGFINTWITRGTFDPATGSFTTDAAIKVNDNATATDSFQPEVAADAGTVAVAWYDRRLACGTNKNYFTRPGATNYCLNTGIQFFSDTGSGLARLGTNIRASATTWDAQQPGDWLDKGVGDLPHSQFGSCFSPGVQGQICVSFIGDYFGLALANGNAYVLNVSTAPQFNATRTLPPADRSWWNSTAAFWESQDVATGGLTNFYQQQVLQIVPIPSGP